MASHTTSKLFVLDHRELAFLQKISCAEYQFITDDEQVARQLLRDKLNEVVLNPRENRIAVNLTTVSVEVPVTGEVLLAWGTPTVGATSTSVPGESFVVLAD